MVTRDELGSLTRFMASEYYSEYRTGGDPQAPGGYCQVEQMIGKVAG